MNYRSVKPGTMLAPVPAVLVSCADEHLVPNALAVAWTGIVCSKPPMLSISLKKERFSYQLIRASGVFTVNLVSEALLPALDTCGVLSGRDKNKFEACGLAPLPVPGFEKAPAVDGTPLYLNCRVTSVQALGSHDLFLAAIENIGIRDDLLDADGRVMLEKAGLVTYCHGVYYGLSAARRRGKDDVCCDRGKAEERIASDCRARGGICSPL